MHLDYEYIFKRFKYLDLLSSLYIKNKFLNFFKNFSDYEFRHKYHTGMSHHLSKDMAIYKNKKWLIGLEFYCKISQFPFHRIKEKFPAYLNDIYCNSNNDKLKYLCFIFKLYFNNEILLLNFNQAYRDIEFIGMLPFDKYDGTNLYNTLSHFTFAGFISPLDFYEVPIKTRFKSIDQYFELLDKFITTDLKVIFHTK